VAGDGRASGAGAAVSAGVGTAGVIRTGPETVYSPVVTTTAPVIDKSDFAGGGPSINIGNASLKPDAAQIRVTGHPVGLKVARARGKKAVVIRNKKQLQFQAGLLIQALEQAVNYQPRPQSNDPAPELYRDLALEKVANLREVKALVAELRRLNDLLAKSKQVKSTQKPVVEVRKHLNTFLGSFAKSAGTGAGLLVIGVAATILHNTGYLDPSILPHRGH